MTSFRLSRLSHPRATLLAMILVALVFLTFGALAESVHTVSPATVATENVSRGT